MQLNGHASEGVDQRDLDRGQHIVASQIGPNSSADSVEGFGGIGAAIERARGQQLWLSGTMWPTTGGPSPGYPGLIS